MMRLINSTILITLLFLLTNCNNSKLQNELNQANRFNAELVADNIKYLQFILLKNQSNRGKFSYELPELLSCISEDLKNNNEITHSKKDLEDHISKYNINIDCFEEKISFKNLWKNYQTTEITTVERLKILEEICECLVNFKYRQTGCGFRTERIIFNHNNPNYLKKDSLYKIDVSLVIQGVHPTNPSKLLNIISFNGKEFTPKSQTFFELKTNDKTDVLQKKEITIKCMDGFGDIKTYKRNFEYILID